MTELSNVFEYSLQNIKFKIGIYLIEIQLRYTIQKKWKLKHLMTYFFARKHHNIEF